MLNTIKKIFNWKNFAFLWAILYIFSLLLISPAEYSGMRMSSYQTFLGIFQSFVDLFILAILFALGFKKILFSKKQLCCILLFIFTISAINLFLYNHIVHTLLLKDIILWFLSLLPITLFSYCYWRNTDKYAMVNKPILKILSIYMVIDIIISVIKILLWEYSSHIIYTIPDYINMAASVLWVPFLLGYAWNFKYKTNKVIKNCAIVLIIISLLSSFLCSKAFLNDSGMFTMLSNIAGIIYVTIWNICICYLMYMFVFKKND